MKRITIWYLIILSIAMLSSCIVPEYLVFSFENTTVEDLTVVLGYRDERNDTTIILDNSYGLSNSMRLFGSIAPLSIKSEVTYDGEKECDNYIREKYHGLLHIFVVRTADIEKYGWKAVVSKNLVLQRYDLTDNDLEGINKYVSFPPTPDMLNISMWPPYGSHPTRPTK